MTTILCYGDSNTFGYDPETGLRFSRAERWPGRLQELLGEAYYVIEEGCNGRTTVFEDPAESWKNGRSYLKACLNSHKPVDLFVMMLGSNDLKRMFHADAEKIAAGAELLIKDAMEFTKLKQGFAPKILLIAPPRIGENILEGPFRDSFDESAPEQSGLFSVCYRKVAERNGCLFLDAAACVQPSEDDGLHLTRESHAKLAEALADLCRTAL